MCVFFRAHSYEYLYHFYQFNLQDNVAIDTRGKRSDRFRPNRNFYLPYRILKIKEPNYDDFAEGTDEIVIPDEDVSILPYTYFHESSPSDYADCEAIFLDHTGWGDASNSIGDLYLITKWSSSKRPNNRLFQIPLDAWSSENRNTTAEDIAYRGIGQSRPTSGGITIYNTVAPPSISNDYDANDPFFRFQWTGADMKRDGTVLALNNPTNTSLFLRCPGESVVDALVGKRGSNYKICDTLTNPASGQSETTAFTPGMTRILQIPEGSRPRMGWTQLIVDASTSVTRTCPAYHENTDIATPPPTTTATTNNDNEEEDTNSIVTVEPDTATADGTVSVNTTTDNTNTTTDAITNNATTGDGIVEEDAVMAVTKADDGITEGEGASDLPEFFNIDRGDPKDDTTTSSSATVHSWPASKTEQASDAP